MIQVDIKPLSVNEAWQGKRFKTKKYKFYERSLLLLLPNNRDIGDNQKLEISIEFGFSNKLSDVDNPVKCFIDVLQKKYQFNDCHIYKLNLTKEIVKKGKEYIKFDIKRIEQ